MSVCYESLKARTACVTGGSRGIGRSSCKMLAANGVSVIVHFNRNKAAAHELVKEIVGEGGTAVAIQADLGSAASVEELARQKS